MKNMHATDVPSQAPIVIVDYGMGNLRSILKAFQRLHLPAVISSNPCKIEHAGKLILPGVGHFRSGMAHLQKLDLIPALNIAVLERKVPILGICLGMQLFGVESEEGSVVGLGWLDASTRRFTIQDTKKYKIPHMGWNSITAQKSSSLLNGLNRDALFYFVHSYHVVCNRSDDILCVTAYENEFVSAVQRNNIYGTQFHPEKSHKSGMQMLLNFAQRV